ncbi:transmembrane protein 236 [Denticeps clupeoides]|uniref:Transmembrane protein 236 n=1 Tax=Denticeps clupeoides TaxID=299321 RepID=A0AAY4A8S0_9TELE|nr:transmembrane protein 236-like [Denticeps clupeoides]
MSLGKTIKLVVYELLLYACLCVPIFVVMERFASLMWQVRSKDLVAYWLVVAASIAYVTSVTLVVWVPLKYFILRSRFFSEVTAWRPVTLAFVILSTLPCFAIVVASSKVQLDGEDRFDGFTELPVSLVLFSLVIVDVVERIRPFRLTGQAEGLEHAFEMPTPVLTHLEQVPTVSSQLSVDRGQNGLPTQLEGINGSFGCRRADSEGYFSRASSSSYLYSTRATSGRFGFLWAREPRADLFVDSFLFWMDTAEMVRAAEEPSVYYSAWIFPVYLLAYLSVLRLVVSPDSPMLSSLGVMVQDLPFLIVRICLIAVFGHVTPLFYVMKNMLVCLTFLYFHFLTKLKIFKMTSMF